MATSPGQRGKYAERKVHEWLQKVDQQVVKWDFERIGDARSGGGRGAKTVVGDFSFFAASCYGVIEVKEIAHDFRLPSKNVSQLPKMRKRFMAGGDCYIVVYHSTTKKWRRIPVMDLEVKTTGSWDLSAYPEYDSVEEALPLHILGG